MVRFCDDASGEEREGQQAREGLEVTWALRSSTIISHQPCTCRSHLANQLQVVAQHPEPRENKEANIEAEGADEPVPPVSVKEFVHGDIVAEHGEAVEEDVEEEVSIVPHSDSVADEGAVVVEDEGALPLDSAVLGPQGSDDVASVAEGRVEVFCDLSVVGSLLPEVLEDLVVLFTEPAGQLPRLRGGATRGREAERVALAGCVVVVVSELVGT